MSVDVRPSSADPMTLRIESADLGLTPCGDAVMVAALPLAMQAGERLEVEQPVTKRLLEAVPTIQDILAVWWHLDGRVSVDADLVESPAPGVVHAGVVDGSVQAVHLEGADDAPDRLIVVDGLAGERPHPTPADRPMVGSGHPMRRASVVRMNAAGVGEAFGLDWETQYRGMATVAACHLLSDVGRVDLPAPFSVHYLFPWTSHPVLDPLWSGDEMTVRHRHGELDWIQRLRAVAALPGGVDQLRVCRSSDLVEGCGACPSCLVLSAGLAAIGLIPVTAVDLAGIEDLPVANYAALADMAVLLRHIDRTAQPALVDAVEAAVTRLEPASVHWPDNWLSFLTELGSAYR